MAGERTYFEREDYDWQFFSPDLKEVMGSGFPTKNVALSISYHFTDYAMMRPFMSKKITLSSQPERNAQNLPIDEIWSPDLATYPMNRSLRVNMDQVRKIKSEWREFLYGDKFFSCVTFYDKDDHVLAKMNSHPQHLVLPDSYVTNEVVVEERIKANEALIGI